MNKTLKAKISADATKFTREMAKVRTTVSNTATFISGAMVAGAGYGFKKASEEAIGFEKGMREVNTLLEYSDRELQSLSNQVLKLASDMGIDLTDATRGLYEAVSRGVPKENMIDFLEIAAKSAVGGLADLESTVISLTGQMNAFNMKTLADTEKFADILFTTVKYGGTTFRDLSTQIGQVVPIAANLGISMENVAAGYVGLTKAGMSTEQATTAIKQSMNSLLGAGDKLKPLLDSIADKYGESSWRGVEYITVLQEIANATEGDSEALKELIPNIRGLLGVM